MSASKIDFAIRPMSDCAFQVRLDNAEKRERLLAARYLAYYLEEANQKLPFLSRTEFVAGYSSVLVTFEPENAVSVQKWLEAQVQKFEQSYEAGQATRKGQRRRIGVRYGGEFGPDLDEVARLNKLTPDELIRLHSSQIYEVYLIGFAPGFAYLGPLPPGLDAPRLSQPRSKIPAGSVATAAGMTAVYPLASPGGWRLIGHTTAKVFVPSQEPPVLFLPGDEVEFYAINS